MTFQIVETDGGYLVMDGELYATTYVFPTIEEAQSRIDQLEAEAAEHDED